MVTLAETYRPLLTEGFTVSRRSQAHAARVLEPVTRQLVRTLHGVVTATEWGDLLLGGAIPAVFGLRIRDALDQYRPQLHAALLRPLGPRELLEATGAIVQVSRLPRSVADSMARAQVAELVVGLEARQLEVLRLHLARVFERGVSAPLLEDIAATTGLTPRQVSQVANHRVRLERLGLPRKSISAALRRLEEELLMRRARDIAITEANAFTNRILQRRGELVGGARKRWRRVPGRGFHDECQENHDSEPIPMRHAFPSGHLAPAAHTRCTCLLELVVPT